VPRATQQNRSRSWPLSCDVIEIAAIVWFLLPPLARLCAFKARWTRIPPVAIGSGQDPRSRPASRYIMRIGRRRYPWRRDQCRSFSSALPWNALCALLPPNREPVSHVIPGPNSLGQVKPPGRARRCFLQQTPLWRPDSVCVRLGLAGWGGRIRTSASQNQIR